MNSFNLHYWNKFKSWRKKARYNELTEWREHLVDYEVNLLIPEVKARVDALKIYFEEINSICDLHMNDVTFGAALRMVIDPTTLATKQGYINVTDQALAQKYFSEMKTMVVDAYISPTNEIIKKSKITNLSEFGSYLNQVNFLCSSIIQIKQKIFLYNMRVFHTLHAVPSGQLVQAQPAEYTLIIMPFKILLENIISVAEATSGTIHHWHKEQMEWKTKSMNVWTEKLNRKNQLLTIVVSLSLATLFLAIPEGYKSYEQDRIIKKQNGEIDELRAKLTETQEELKSKKIYINDKGSKHKLKKQSEPK